MTAFELPVVCEELRVQALGFRAATPERVLVGARLFDTLRDARSPLPPVSAWESESAGLDVEGLRRLAVLVEAARVSALRVAVASCLKVSTTPLGAFTELAREESRLLTVELVATSPFRTEELARKWIRRLGGRVEGESPAESEKELERLDFGGVLGNLKKAEAEREARMKKLREAEEKRRKEQEEAYARMGRE